MEQILNEILDAVKMKMENQGDYSREAYKGFIDEAIDDFIKKGVLTDADNTEMMIDKLMSQYKDVLNRVC
ncbi:MAG: hypothetical protein U9O55_01425 [Patescibacteria group bacterium]|nr:hypothetical protein [Patescibacteria group bacterium]